MSISWVLVAFGYPLLGVVIATIAFLVYDMDNKLEAEEVVLFAFVAVIFWPLVLAYLVPKELGHWLRKK